MNHVAYKRETVTNADGVWKVTHYRPKSPRRSVGQDWRRFYWALRTAGMAQRIWTAETLIGAFDGQEVTLLSNVFVARDIIRPSNGPET